MKSNVLFVLALLFPIIAFSAVPTTFEWDQVITKTDGSLLTNLAGYKLQCGSQSGNYTQIQDIPLSSLSDPANPSISNTIATSNGTYYCVATAYDTDGFESGYSNEVNFTVAVPPAAPANLR